MGQKVSPVGLRIGINKDWNATWYADKKTFAANLKEDQDIKNFINKEYRACAISKVTIERTEGKLAVNIFTAKPGMIIGTKGAGIEVIKKQIAKLIRPVKLLLVNVKEVKRPDLDAQLVAESIVGQLEKRVAAKRALKQAIERVMKAGAKGCKLQVSGVLAKANEKAQVEKQFRGSVPLHTLRADIDYGEAAAYTIIGKIGVKCWIYKGEILGKARLTTKEDNKNVNA
ncbi:MAG: 30S ribosomal protein S3 [Clostridiales bacterium]|nr:30S ribosomal protein S3 [Clostridiales bacterium]